jgi:hypothetical protein
VENKSHGHQSTKFESKQGKLGDGASSGTSFENSWFDTPAPGQNNNFLTVSLRELKLEM